MNRAACAWLPRAKGIALKQPRKVQEVMREAGFNSLAGHSARGLALKTVARRKPAHIVDAYAKRQPLEGKLTIDCRGCDARI